MHETGASQIHILSENERKRGERELERGREERGGRGREKLKKYYAQSKFPKKGNVY